MAEFQIKKDSLIFEAGSRLTFLANIESGSVKMELPGTEIILKPGDVIGLCDLTTHLHTCNYYALEDTLIETYPCATLAEFSKNLCSSKENTGLFFHALDSQFRALSETYTLMRYECSTMFSYIHNSYADYCSFCKKSALSPKELPGLTDFPMLSLDVTLETWQEKYYADLHDMCNDEDFFSLENRPAFYNGLLLTGCNDMHIFLKNFHTMEDYLKDLSVLLINEDSTDFLDLYSSLLLSVAKDGMDTAPVNDALSRLMLHIEGFNCIDAALYQNRMEAYEELMDKLEDMSINAASIAHDKELALSNNVLNDSLQVILNYCGCDEETAIRFRRAINAYKALQDKTSTDAGARELRQELTDLFYQIYLSAFQISIQDEEIPTILRMFFTFGYVDEDLAGFDNAVFLYSIVNSFKGNPQLQIYTIYEWLLLIYQGKKEPRKNEFDLDYPAYVAELLGSGKINEERAKKLLEDCAQKVLFELSCMFPVANRMTYGRIATFCPIFSEHNVTKPLDSCLATPDKICGALQQIRETDYSAFYRSTLYTSPQFGINREYIYVESLPDVILLPNVGTRGVMWQEIEGKDRSTPATFLLPIFTLENLNLLLTRMTGEFRWEMCRRIQGTRWNDVTEHSLTSDYYDYLQFYKKNNDLSPESKEKCSLQLKKCKNNFKEYFLLDYLFWILYESKGSPRLNRISRSILFRHCPFPKKIRTTLLANPLYESVINKWIAKQNKEIRRMDTILYRCRKYKGSIPPELESQKAYLDL